MSIFLGFVSADREAFFSVDVDDFLPFDARIVHRHWTNTAGMNVFDFGEALGRAPVVGNDCISQVVGLPMEAGSTDLPDFSQPDLGALKSLHQRLHGGYVALICKDDGATVVNGYSGEHTAYHRSVGDLHLVSNRLSLLLAFGEAELDPIAGGYMAAHGYIFGRRTAYEGISRLLPGDILEITRAGFSIHAPDLSPDYEPIPRKAAREVIEEAVDRLVERTTYIADHYAAQTVIPLSGGKDSRAILSSMCAQDRRPELNQIYTNGYHYSPEVLSASRLVEALGIPERHVIRRPALTRPPSALAEIVMRSLNASEGQFSVFDHSKISQDGRISVGGHQNSIRDTALPRFPSELEGKSPDYLVQMIERDKSLNPSGLLSREGEASIRTDYEGQISEFLERGARPEKTPETFGWMTRTAGWVAITNNVLTYAASPIHPLLDRSLMRLALGLPRDILESEAFHFLAMLRAGRDVWDVPFAGQRWSKTLNEGLDQLSYRGPRPNAVAPFMAHKAFPDAANPYLTNEKHEIHVMLSRFCMKVFPGLSSRLPWVDAKAVPYICREDAPSSLLIAIGQKGVFASILCAYFGRDLYRRSQRERIKAEIGAMYTAIKQEQPTEIQLLREHVVRLEKSVAQFVVERQAEPARAIASTAAPAKGPWRFAEIVNETAQPLSYRLRKEGSTAHPKPVHLDPGQVFSHGVREAGTFEIIADDSDVAAKVEFGTGDFARVVRLSD
jgi:hypothetical protein